MVWPIDSIRRYFKPPPKQEEFVMVEMPSMQDRYLNVVEENERLRAELNVKRSWKWRASKWAFLRLIDYLPSFAAMIVVHPAVYHASNLYSLFSGLVRLSWSFMRR